MGLIEERKTDLCNDIHTLSTFENVIWIFILEVGLKFQNSTSRQRIMTSSEVEKGSKRQRDKERSVSRGFPFPRLRCHKSCSFLYSSVFHSLFVIGG